MLKPIIAAVATAGSLLSCQAQAYTAAECVEYATLAEIVTQDRNNGVPEVDWMVNVATADASDNSKFEAVHLVHEIYTNPKLARKTPEEIGGIALVACLDPKKTKQANF